VSLWIQSYMPGVANQSETKSHISYCVTAKSHISIHGHINITPSLPHAHTYLCSARFIIIITHQHDSDRYLQASYIVMNSWSKILRLIHEQIRYLCKSRIKPGKEPRVGQACFMPSTSNQYSA